MNETHQQLNTRIEELQVRLEEAESTLEAIRSGEVDALVVGEQIFTLENAERPYRVLIEAMQEGTVTLSTSGLILYANQRFAEMLKMPLERVLGVFIHNFVAPDDQPRFDVLRAHGNDNRAELHLQASDGTLVPVSVAAGTIAMDEGSAECLVITDLTVQKRREQEIILLQKLQLMVTEAMSLENALRVVLNHVAEATGWVYGEAWMHSLETNSLTRVSTWNKSGSQVMQAADKPSAFIKYVWHTYDSPWVPDIGFDVRFAEDDQFKAMGVRSAFATPVLTGNKIVAVIAFFATTSFYMDQYFARLASTVAAQLGSFIQRKQMEEALVKARQELESRVQERTAELTQANHALQKEVAERTRIANRISRLQGVITALSASLTVEQVANVMIDRGLAAVGAVGGQIMMTIDSGKHLKTLASKYLPGDDWQMQMVRDKEPLWQSRNGQCEVIIPLVLHDTIIGVFHLRLPTDQVYEDDKRFMLTLARECAQALERARLYEAEAKARLEAEAANKTKLRFLAMISHELRTPLTSIKGFASTLLADDVEWEAAAQRSFVQIIDDEADKLKDLIEQLLDLSQLHAGMLKITPGVYTVQDILDDALTHLETVTRAHQFSIHLASADTRLFVDKNRIVQVVTNLVENSVKYSALSTHIVLDVYEENGYVRCDVQDQGIGIPLEYRESVFEAFHQLADSKKGIGLGLAICKGLIEAHGGRIWIEEKTSPGTMISFTLPLLVG